MAGAKRKPTGDDVAVRPAEAIRSARAIDAAGWDGGTCDALIEPLAAIRAAMLDREAALAAALGTIDPGYLPSARNFAHYLALRRFDLRPLQGRLAALGVSSLGRAESHVLANLDKVLGILHRLAGRAWLPKSDDEPTGIHSSAKLLERHTADLLGARPDGRAVRIMVTLPSEAAGDFGFVRKLVQAGMDVARINCAHDGAAEWQAMAALVRRAARSVGRPVRILMDLGGPKLRTAALEPGPAVLKLRPTRDAFGRVTEPARLGLRGAAEWTPIDGARCQIAVDAGWLAQLRVRDRIELRDARGARRSLTVVRRFAHGVLVESAQTAYLTPETRMKRPPRGSGARYCRPLDIPPRPAEVHLERGDVLRLVREPSRPRRRARKRAGHAVEIGCTLPQVFAQVRKGERVWFDDGRIGGFVRAASADWIEVEITDARAGGEKLAADKGINLPDTQLELPALTPKDLEDLAVVAHTADLVGLSFVQSAQDVIALRARLAELGAGDLSVVLKVETRRAFEHLPELLFAAMAHRAAGVMIARGDLAVECGYERLAEVQEEILWACEAAHLPVIWATQVLETLAKTGRPSRAEITDAAMGERSECVMLNKGPYVLDAIRTLDDILKRMQAHQSKKRPLLRALRAWSTPLPPLAAPRA